MNIVGFLFWSIVGIILLVIGSNYKKKIGICDDCGNVVKKGNVCQKCGNPISNKNKTISTLCLILGWLTLISNVLSIFVNMFLF